MNYQHINKYNYFNILLAFLIIAIITTSVGVLTNEYITKGSFSASSLGYIISARSFGYLIGAYLSIKLFQKISYFKIVSFYLLGVSLLMCILGVSKNLIMLVLIFSLFGIFKNLITVGGNQISSDLYKQNVQPNLMNNLQFIYGIGTFISPLFAGYVLSQKGMSTLIVIFVLLPLVNAFMFMIRKSDISTKKGGKENIINDKKSNRLIIILINLFFAFYAGFEIYVGTWGTYVMSSKMHNQSLVYFCNSVFWLSLASSKILFTPFLRFLKKETHTIYLSIILTIIFTAGYMVTKNDIAILSIMGGLGFSMGNIVPSTIKYLSATNKVSSAETAWCFVGAGIGGMIFSKMYGNLLETNIQNSFLFGFLQLFAITVIFILLSTRKNNIRQKETEKITFFSYSIHLKRLRHIKRY